uniref:Large ribosomal subunit protein bL36c n=1 Tax=Pteridomonas danica TaxID=38822 RepID=A0A7T1C5B9_9STRA|nr:ribosomal protein L36 [Pteridomonas danica]QPM99305.1 ribosomal protein L36 [Pteridomonas danica]
MKVRSSIKKICKFCKILKRKKILRICCIIAKHKQRQKF